MSEEEKNNGKSENSEREENIDIENTSDKYVKKNSIFGKIFKVLKYFFIFLVVLLIGIFIFIQTDLFSNLALDYTLNILNESFAEKETTIHAESLDGNILKGFTLNNGSIKVKGDTLLKFNSLSAKYDILKLLSKEIFSRELILREPQINLTKIRDKNDSLKWNFEYFLESDDKEEDTTTSEFDWGITAESFKIENGYIRILENKDSDLPIREIQMRQIDTFNVSEFDIKELDLNLSAKYFPEEKDVNIKNLSFSTNSKFNLKQFSVQANINARDTLTEVKKLQLITDRSNISINQIKLEDLNLMDGLEYEKLEKKDTKIDIAASPINADDLSFFLPDLDFIDSTITFNLKAEDAYGDLKLKNLDIKTEKSEFHFTGIIKNLHSPDSLYFDITGNDISIDPRDTKILLPGLQIPDYSHIGVVTIPDLKYKGEPDNFETDFDIISSAGKTYGNLKMDLRGNDIVYKGDVKTSGVNLGKIFKDKELEGSISGEFIVDAKGFDYKTNSGSLKYKLVSTKFYGLNIAASEGKILFNRGNLNLDVSIRSNLVNAKTKGKLNVSNPKNLSYDLTGTVSNLDLQVITKDATMKSNLTFDFDVNGRGVSPDDIAGNFKIDLKPSEFGGYNIPETPLLADIDQKGNVRKISLKTGFADVEADGYFNFTELLDLVIKNSEKISKNITDKFFPDSTSVQPVVSQNGYSVNCNNYYMNYSVDIRDLSPLYGFLNNDTIIFKGMLKGSVSDSCGLFTFNTHGNIDNFEYGDSLFMLKDANLNLFIRNETGSDDLDKFYSDITLNSNKVIAVKNKFDSVFTKINFFNNDNEVFITANKDSTLKLYTDLSLKDSGIFVFDSLSVNYHSMHLANNSDLQIKLIKQDSSMTFDFRKFTVSSFNQRVSIDGFFSMDDSSNVNVKANNINLYSIQKILRPEDDFDTIDVINGNFRRTVLSYKGYPHKIDLSLETNSDVLAIGETKIGRLDAFIDYKDEELKTDIAFYNINNAGNFKLAGILPILNKSKPEYKDTVLFNKRRSEASVNMSAKADNFQLKIFQQLLPYTKDLEGILNGEIKLVGKTSEPDLNGNMNLNKGKFYVTLTKMKYDFEAGISTDNEKIVINNSKVFLEEDPSKFLSATGYIDLTDLKLTDIDLRMTGDVKAFDKDNGPTELGISGDLWVGSGSPSLNIKGNSDRLDLTGNLNLVKGNIVFDPFVQEAYNVYSDDFNYGVIIDSINYKDERIERVLESLGDSVIVIKGEYLNPFEKLLYSDSHKGIKYEQKEKSGKFYYDLLITTSGNVFLKFIVNKKSQQEFFGEIKTNLQVDNKNNYQMTGKGTVTLGSNCYYKFFRKFDASGKVNFNGEITNPELDIIAKYKGYTSVNVGGSGQQLINEVVIDMDVTGKAKNPVLTMTLERNGRRESGSDATSDAISYLLFGKFKDQLTFSESSSFGASIGASVLSNYVASSLETVLPFLINTDVNYIDSESGSIAENTDIRFTAAIGGAVIRFGGQIFKGIANTDIVIDYPVSKMLNLENLSDDLVLRVERVYDPFSSASTDAAVVSGTRAGALIYYRIKF